MNIKRAKEEIKNTVLTYLEKDVEEQYVIPAIHQRPVLLIGAPGIGKTQIMEQIAREMRIGLVSYTITHHTRQSAVGLPFIQEENFGGKAYSVTEYTMSEIIASVYRKIEQDGLKEGILFIDEINCVSETLAPTMLQFLQCKTFGNQAIPEGWIIVAAGNPPEYNKSVRDFDMVTLDRVRRIEVEPDYRVWKEYARAQHVNAALLSYLELRPQNFYRVQTDVDGMQFVTARGWEDLSNLMDSYLRMDLSVDEEIIQEFIQFPDVAQDVAAYWDLYRKYQGDYGIEEILKGEASPKIFERLTRAAFDERLSVVNLLLSGLDRQFMAVDEIKMVTDRWYRFLKEYRQAMKDAPEQIDYAAVYLEKLELLEQEYQDNKQSGFLTKKEQKSWERLLKHLQRWNPENHEEPKQAFLAAKKGFDRLQDELVHTEDQTMRMLEHAFRFMEDAFMEGPEMVVFVTELTMGKESAAFLQDNRCESYLNYNQKLLVGSRRTEILSKLTEDKIRAEEHMRDF